MTLTRRLPTLLGSIGIATAIALIVLTLSSSGQAATASRAPRPASAAASDGTLQSVGTIVALSRTDITFRSSSGSDVVAPLPASAVNYFTSNHVIRLCETAELSYQTTTAGIELESLLPTGVTTSRSVSIGNRKSCRSVSDGEVDRVGSITALSSSSVTLALVSGGSATYRLARGRDLQADESLGDLADVTYVASSRIAYNLENAELYTTGVITSVGYHSMTIRETATGKSVTFPPDAAAYINLHKGNRVGVDYVIDRGKPEADNVADLSTGVSN